METSLICSVLSATVHQNQRIIISLEHHKKSYISLLEVRIFTAFASSLL